MNSSDFCYHIVAKDSFRNIKSMRVDSIPSQYHGVAYKSVASYDRTVHTDINSGKRLREINAPCHIRSVILDLDMGKRILEQTQSKVVELIEFLNFEIDIPIESVKIFFSGKKGFHIEIPSKLFGIKPDYNLERKIYRLVDLITTDLHIRSFIDWQGYAPNRFIRLPNSRHQDSGFYKYPLQFQELRDCSIKEIQKLAKHVREATWFLSDKEFQTIESCTNLWKEASLTARRNPNSDILSEGVQEGNRHNRAFEITRVLRDNGYSKKETVRSLIQWNKWCDPPIPNKSEIISIVYSTFRRTQNRTSIESNFQVLWRFIRDNSIIRQLSPPEFRSFIELLARTNHRDKVWKGIPIGLGQIICSQKSLAFRSGVEKHQARSMLNKIEKAGYIHRYVLNGRYSTMITWQGYFAELFQNKNTQTDLLGDISMKNTQEDLNKLAHYVEKHPKLPELSSIQRTQFWSVIRLVLAKDFAVMEIDIEMRYIVLTRIISVIQADLTDEDALILIRNPSNKQMRIVSQRLSAWPLWVFISQSISHDDDCYEVLRRYSWLIGLQYFTEEYNNASISNDEKMLSQNRKFMNDLFNTTITDYQILKRIGSRIPSLRENVQRNLAEFPTYTSVQSIINECYTDQ